MFIKLFYQLFHSFIPSILFYFIIFLTQFQKKFVFWRVNIFVVLVSIYTSVSIINDNTQMYTYKTYKITYTNTQFHIILRYNIC